MAEVPCGKARRYSIILCTSVVKNVRAYLVKVTLKKKKTQKSIKTHLISHKCASEGEGCSQHSATMYLGWEMWHNKKYV